MSNPTAKPPVESGAQLRRLSMSLEDLEAAGGVIDGSDLDTGWEDEGADSGEFLLCCAAFQ